MKRISYIIVFVVLTQLVFISFNTFSQKKITIDDIYRNETFYLRSFTGIKSLKDGEHYSKLEVSGIKKIIKYSYLSGEQTETIFNSAEVNIPNFNGISSYDFSEDESKLLICTNYESIYRHSFTANYYIYDIKNHSVEALSEKGKQQLASFSPDGTKVSFVRDNNIFVKNLTNGNEIQLTTDGEINKIINGAPDWVYEEEFSYNRAYSWSPDSKKIIFLKSDESEVKMFSMAKYGKLYPENYNYKYPKAGENNSKVSVHIINVETKNIIEVDLGNQQDIYIPRIMFTENAETAAAIKLNRLQNKYELFLINAENGSSQNILTINDPKYIEINDDLTFLKDKQHFILSNETSGFNHLYLYNINGKLINQITKGEWDVMKFYGIDEKKQLLYFQAAKTSPLNRDIYTININGDNLTQISTNIGTNNAEFSSTLKYYINKYSNANTPTCVTLNDCNGNIIREIETNVALNKKISKEGEYKFSKKEFFVITTEDGIALNAWIIKPNDFKTNKKYPVLMYVYGGPGDQTVLNSWDRYMPWWQMLAQEGYIVVSVDNRGTKARGKDFRQSTYKQLGKYEVQDQICAAKYLGSQKYVDKNRIGIFGWSFGGYMSALCLTVGAEYFKAGIAVAPVTNWRYYDSIYTERYNGLPQDNKSGYDDNSPINHTNKMKGNFLLVHGMEDDNVHFQNTVDFVSKLIYNDIQFETIYYPSCDHGIDSRHHLFTKLTNFIKNNL